MTRVPRRAVTSVTRLGLTRWTGVNVSRQLLQQWARSWGEGKAA